MSVILVASKIEASFLFLDFLQSWHFIKWAEKNNIHGLTKHQIHKPLYK